MTNNNSFSRHKRTEIYVPDGWYHLETEVRRVVDFVGFWADLNPENRTMTWRGMPNSDWALTSTLFDVLTVVEGCGKLVPPDEKLMQAAEKQALDTAKITWRYQEQNGLKIFAQLQHLGAPTRLIDITKNPLVALYFACQPKKKRKCERDVHTADCLAESQGQNKIPADGRVIGFAASEIDLQDPVDSKASHVFWFDEPYQSNRPRNWGGDKKHNFWFPSIETHPRIFAQNAGFIYGGIPIFGSAITKTSNYNKPGGGTWSSEEILQGTNVHYNLTKKGAKSNWNQETLPAWTVRIPAECKEEMLLELDRLFGITAATLFPGIEGLAQSVWHKKGNLYKFR